MPVGLLGRKIGMTQVYDGESVVPVTVLEVGPCTVLQLRTKDRDQYEAVQLGFDDKARRKASRSERGHVAQLSSKRQKALTERRDALAKAGVSEEQLPSAPAKAGCEPKRFVREFRTDGEDHGLEVGQVLTAAVFNEAPFVDVIGRTKGRGFTGAMKRHNFSGQRASHGVKRVHRHVGSIGQSADPSRTMRGGKMPGHYGDDRVTVRHLKVVRVDEANNMLLVRGAVPGRNGGYVIVRHTNKY